MGGALVQRQRGRPVGDAALRDGGGLKVAEVSALLAQVQQVPEKGIFPAGGLALPDSGLHLRDLLLQRFIFLLQRFVVGIVILLIRKPAGNGGGDRPERGSDSVRQIHQRGGVGAEVGQQRQSHGDDRPGKENPKPIVFQKVFQMKVSFKISGKMSGNALTAGGCRTAPASGSDEGQGGP